MNERWNEEDSEAVRLRDWGTRWTPPRELRADTLQSAKDRGLVRGALMERRSFTIGLTATAAVLMFVAGFGVGARREPAGGSMEGGRNRTATQTAGVATDSGSRYALFLFEDDAYERAPSGHEMERVQEYSAWARSVRASGEELSSEGRFCRVENGDVVASEPQSDARRGHLAGYFVIGARSLEDAFEVAKTCPHLKHHGTLELRKLEG